MSASEMHTLNRRLRTLNLAIWLRLAVSTSLSVAFGLAFVVTGAHIWDQLSPVTDALAGSRTSLDKLCVQVTAGLAGGAPLDELTWVYTTRSLVSPFDVAFRLSVFPGGGPSADPIVPGSPELESHLTRLAAPGPRPVLGHPYVFYGTNGVGKSHAARTAGRVLSRHGPVVVLAVQMSEFLSPGPMGDKKLYAESILVMEAVEACVGRADALTVWVFDELDTFLLATLGRDYFKKDVSLYVENGGFTDGRRRPGRLLVMTMNNADLLSHDYWNPDALGQPGVEAALERALALTGLTRERFLVEGQLSRLHSFVGNRFFEFRKLDAGAALRFAEDYVEARGADARGLQAVRRKLAGEPVDRTYNLRYLVSLVHEEAGRYLTTDTTG